MLASRSLTSVDVTHPSERGALIFEQFLCGDLTQTPSAEQHTKPAKNVGETPRDWLARVTAPATCRSCHQAIDPLGVAFEHYAYSGVWRDADGGLALDARGTIAGIDTAGSFDGALQLIDRLASSRDVRACHVRKWMETAYGRPVVAADACSQAELEQGFAASGGNIRDLLTRSHPDRGVPLQACTMKPPSKLRLTRRSVLKGAGGIAIALPWLEAMTHRRPARAAAPTDAPKRFLAVYTPGGTVPEKWTPTGSETDFTLSPILAPLEPVKSRLLVLGGLHLKCGDQSLFTVEQHQGGMMGWLTGQVQPGAGNYVKGPSIDQVLAPGLSGGQAVSELADGGPLGDRTGRTDG